MLGLPSEVELYEMSDQMTEATVNLIYKIDNIPRKDFTKILPKEYAKKDIEHAADLLTKMLAWSPKDRLSCEEALRHDFFKR